MNKEKQQLLINSLIFAVKVFNAAKSADVALWHFQDSEKLENLPDEITKLFNQYYCGMNNAELMLTIEKFKNEQANK